MNFKFVTSKRRGGQNLIIDNFSRCSMNNSLSKINSKPSEHNHDPPADEIKDQNIRRGDIERVNENPTKKLQAAYNEHVQTVDEDYLAPSYGQEN